MIFDRLGEAYETNMCHFFEICGGTIVGQFVGPWTSSNHAFVGTDFKF